jgi:hypothetical protein
MTSENLVAQLITNWESCPAPFRLGAMAASLSANRASMNDERLTSTLACRVLGWRLAPGRFIKTDRSWLPRYRLAPLTRLDDAFQTVDRVAIASKLVVLKVGRVTAEVQVGGRVGKVSGNSKARTVTMALVSALGMEHPDYAGALISTPARNPRTRSRFNGG